MFRRTVSCRYIKAYEYSISGRRDLGVYLLRRLKNRNCGSESHAGKYIVFSVFVYFCVGNQFKALDVNYRSKHVKEPNP